MNKILKCDSCERVAHNLSLEDRECNHRLPYNGTYCRGILRAATEERPKDPHLECDSCGRRADRMDFANKTCDFLLPDHRHCQGALRVVDNE